MLYSKKSIQIVPAICVIFVLLITPVAASDYQLNKDVYGKLDKLINSFYSAEQLNGVTAIAVGDSIVYSFAYGNAVHEWDIPNSVETKFQIASITKQFTAVLILQLASEDKLSLDDNIGDHLPEYRSDIGSIVTIRQLLNHTSGIPNYAKLPGFWQDSIRNHYTPDQMISNLCAGDLLFEPGTNYNYSNSGYNLLGYIIEKIEGQPYSKVINDRIFAPLQMQNSGYDDPRYVVKNLATGYHHRIWGIEKSRYYNPDLFHAAGALFATAGDLVKWTRALHTGEVLPDEYYKKMTMPYLNNYGFGIGSAKYLKPGTKGDSLTSSMK